MKKKSNFGRNLKFLVFLVLFLLLGLLVASNHELPASDHEKKARFSLISRFNLFK